MERVLWASPWSFNKYLVILHRFEPEDSVSTISFDKAPFWLQIHGLPMRMQTRDVAERIVGSLGTIEKVDIGGKGFSVSKYLRVRIVVDITQPLCRGRSVRMGGGKAGWVDFRYERLPIFCYWCGIPEHDDRDCPLWISSKKSLGTEDKQFLGPG